MDVEGYIPRVVDDEIRRRLRTSGAVLIEGPKYCGKTTSASTVAASVLYMQDEDTSEDNLKIAGLQPSLLLEGEKPRLIDEWQMAPKLWGAIRFDIDRNPGFGRYILTGSTSPDESTLSHSGAGRIARMRMRTMSLFESGDSTGAVGLKRLFDGTVEVAERSKLDYRGIARVLVRGGWPTSIGLEEQDARDAVESYCDAVLRTDINLPGGRRRDPQRMRAILRSLSRNISTSTSVRTILEGIGGGDTMSPTTLVDYIGTLKSIHVVEDLPAWLPKLRSKTAIRQADTRHLTDPAIAAFFLGAGSHDLEMDPNTFGLLFESLAVRDVRVYSQGIGGDVYHYRDGDGLEADIVVHLHDGRWCAMEVRLGSMDVDKAAKNLLRLSNKVDGASLGAPAFLAVITGTEYAYRREDGVYVIPLGCLGP